MTLPPLCCFFFLAEKQNSRGAKIERIENVRSVFQDFSDKNTIKKSLKYYLPKVPGIPSPRVTLSLRDAKAKCCSR